MTATVVIPVGSIDEPLREQLRALDAQRTDVQFDIVLAVNRPGQVEEAALMAEQCVENVKVTAVDASAKRGAAAARNGGAAAATSDVLLFCDADDIVSINWVEELVKTLTSFDAVTGRVELMTSTDGRQLRWRPPATPGRLPTFLGVPYLLSGNLGIKRAAFAAAGGFDESLSRCEDIAISFKLQSLGYRLGYANDAVLQYRVRDGLRAMLEQHYQYGRGMSQVLNRYGIPDDHGVTKAGHRLLKPNGQPFDRTSPIAHLRRVAIGTGRLVGLLEEKVTRRR